MTNLPPVPAETLSDVALKIYAVLGYEHRGKSKSVPREKLWESIKQSEGFERVSFREFRNGKQELVTSKLRVGSCSRGWFYIVTAREARESAEYLKPHRDSLSKEINTLEGIAEILEAKHPEPKQMEMVPRSPLDRMPA